MLCPLSRGKLYKLIPTILRDKDFWDMLGLVNVHVLTDCLSTTFYNSGASLATRSSRFPGAVATSATLPRPTSSSTSALQPPGGSLTRMEGEPPYSNELSLTPTCYKNMLRIKDTSGFLYKVGFTFAYNRE